jgi:D-alanine-D-alanine ligase
VASKIRVAVLMGGRSSEREVSLSTGRMVMSALDPEKYEAIPIDCAHLGALPALVMGDLNALPSGDTALPNEVPGLQPPAAECAGTPPRRPPGQEAIVSGRSSAVTGAGGKPDVAFIALHGPYGEDGKIQGLLELLDIPYTGSGVLGSALAMNKWMAKKILRAEGVPTPEFLVLEGPAEVERFLALWREGGDAAAWQRPGEPEVVMPRLPVVVKPNEQGSTIGISIVREAAEMAPAIQLAARHDPCVLIERFVAGTEITAAVLGNQELQVLPLVEIVPEGGFYDYERKYTPGATEEIVPARIPAAAAARAEELAIRAHRALRCRGMSRVDMIVGEDGVTVLEVNTIPGMTPTSLLPRAAAAAGISFPRLVDRLIELALEGRSAAAPAPCSR